tara:strand:+ start:685 stop:1806 length:1122 start_codon:yes stop_codon:yes gene_type:complete
MSSQKIKVCHLTSVHPRNDVRIFHKQCKGLSKHYEISLIVADNLGDNKEDDIKIKDVGKPSNRFLRIFIYTWKVFYRGLKTKSQIYHFHDPELFFAGFILKLFGKKVIFDVHENITAQIKDKLWLPVFFRFILIQFFKIINFFSIRLFSIIIAEKSYSDIYKKSSSNNKIVTVLNYPFIDSLKQFRNVNRSGNEFFYIGGVSNHRGLDIIIEAAKILHKQNIDFKIHLIGNVSDEYNIDDCPNLKNKIIFYGRRDFYNGYIISKKCIAGLAVLKPIDNYINSQPTKIFEYMSIGLPIITSKFKLYEEIVEKNKIGLCINPLSAIELAATLNGFIKLEYDVNSMSELGVKLVEEKYSWEKELKKLLELYKFLEN